MPEFYDPKCLELAEHFLGNDATAEAKETLAYLLQVAAEDHIDELQSIGL